MKKFNLYSGSVSGATKKDYSYSTGVGLNVEVVCQISAHKQEPLWMLEHRLKALDYFFKQPRPSWGPDLSALKMDDIHYYIKSVKQAERTWADVPDQIHDTFERLGVPQSERSHLAGLGAQYESEMVYHNLKDEWKKQGIIFLDTDSALKEHPDLFKEYFGSVVPYNDNVFAALNTAVWSGGSFIYIPKGVKLEQALQTYFRIDAERMGQFERTLIIVEDDAAVHYIEGCTAPLYKSVSLHSAVVEIIARPRSRVRYSTIQNWSKNVFNLVTKRAVADEQAVVEWVDGNIGSSITMKYPCVVLKGTGAKAEILSVAMASSAGQIQDSGGKAIHLASDTSSRIVSKSMSSHGGQASYRGVIHIGRTAKNCKSFVQCDALILDKDSRADAYPCISVAHKQAHVAHEASVSKMSDDQLFYVTSRGVKPAVAKAMIVNGFIEPFVKELPMEFAVELNRLIELEMEGSVG